MQLMVSPCRLATLFIGTRRKVVRGCWWSI